MTDLTQSQVDYVTEQVNSSAGGKYEFLAASTAFGDKALFVTARYRPGGATGTVRQGFGFADELTDWLTNDDHFTVVTKKAVQDLHGHAGTL